jgi:SAM-dependent methyltransferase
VNLTQIALIEADTEPDARRDLEQWFTPSWVVEALLNRHFSDLTADDVVIDPGCGHGRWLRMLNHLFPATRAVGVEIDPRLAEKARANGCEVILGDFATVAIPIAPSALVGNWPFGARSFSRFLGRAHALLPNDGRCGVLTSIYNFQTTSRVLSYAEQWSIETEVLPRDMFPRLQDALVFATFRKNRRRILVGLGLYEETSAARLLKPHFRRLIDREPTTWWSAVESALKRLGGEASLGEIYAVTEKVTENKFWREKVRQVLQRHAYPVQRGRWALAA